MSNGSRAPLVVEKVEKEVRTRSPLRGTTYTTKVETTEEAAPKRQSNNVESRVITRERRTYTTEENGSGTQRGDSEAGGKSKFTYSPQKHRGAQEEDSGQRMGQSSYSTFQTKEREEFASPKRERVTETVYSSNLRQENQRNNRSPVKPVEANMARKRSPYKVVEEVIERRQASPTRGHKEAVTKTETRVVTHVIDQKYVKDLELRLISSFKAVIDIEKAVESSKQELSLRPDYSLKDNFKMMDRQGRGMVSFIEFNNFLKKLKVNIEKSSAVSKLFEDADSDRDGMINLIEFTDLICPSQKEYKVLLNCRQERGQASNYDFEKVPFG
jgi:Ca2+-binding EF-hand superfamily protein